MDKKIGFVVTAGHLDIEWYQPMKLYRFWTIETFEELKKIAAERKDFITYVLDGQVFPLEEYLEAVPGDEPVMRELIRTGKLTIGPFYTQFDEWLPGAESMIRNCLYGLHRANAYGGYMRAGYLPDNFGHPRQMPQILRGFGIDSLMFMRGLPEIPGGHPDEFIYRGLDGSEVFVSHFRETYCGAFDIFDKEIDPITPRLSPYYDQYLSFEYHKELAFHDDPERTAKNLVANAMRISERYPSGVVPLIAGYDHLPPQANVGDSIKAANEMQDEIEFIMGDAEEYVRMASGRAEPAVYDMELIGSRYQFALLGALSTRTYLKRQNFACEAMLEKYAEPLSAMASLLGYQYKPALFDEAWTKMLINSAHDSIHGSSTDEVHMEMETRFANVRQIAAGVMHDAMSFIGKRYAPQDGAESIMVYAPVKSGAPQSSTESILVYAPVKSGSPQLAELYLPVRGDGLVVADSLGRALPTQIIEREAAELNAVGQPRNEPFPDELYKKVLFLDTFSDAQIRPYAGVQNISGGQGGVDAVCRGDHGDDDDVAARQGYQGGADAVCRGDLKCGDNFLENKYLRIDAEGALIHITDKTSGRRFYNLNVIEEDADAGDAWDYSPPWLPGEIVRLSGETFTTKLTERGPVRASLHMEGSFSVPARLRGDKRSSERVKIPVAFDVSLISASGRADVKMTFDNTAKDHRIRLRVPMGVKTDVIKSQGHLAIIERDVERPRETETWRQPPTRLLPFREWLAADDGDFGLAVAFKGVYDYEAVRDPRTGRPDVFFTLLRGFEYMSRANTPQRKEQASFTYHTPGAQCPGEHVVEWSYIPYKAVANEKAPFINEADAFLYPPLAHLIRAQKYSKNTAELSEAVRYDYESSTASPLAPYISWDEKNIRFSAFKLRMGKPGCILRLYENQGNATKCRVRLNGFSRAEATEMDERDGSQIPIKDGVIELDFGAYKALTIIAFP